MGANNPSSYKSHVKKMLRRSSGLDSTLRLSKLRNTRMGLGRSSVCVLCRLRIPNGEERIDLLRESQLL